MKLDLDRTAPGRSELAVSGELKLDWAEDRPQLARIRGVLTVDNLERRFLLGGTLQAVGRVSCDRCLAEFDLTWDVPVEVMVLRDVDTDEGQDDSLVLHQATGEVDLAESVRESLILAYPAAVVCRQDCQGICPHCGIDLNRETCSCGEDEVDPRWAGLDALDHGVEDEGK